METFPHAISPHTFPHLWPVSRQFLVHIALVSARDQELPGLRNGCFQLGPRKYPYDRYPFDEEIA